MNNTCVCCGIVIPEGRQVCPICEENVLIHKEEKEKKDDKT